MSKEGQVGKSSKSAAGDGRCEHGYTPYYCPHCGESVRGDLGGVKTRQVWKVWVQAHYPDGHIDHEERELEVKTFQVEPARVTAKYGMTIPLRDKFAFARVDVEVQVPCYVEEIDDTLTFAWGKARDEIREQVGAVKKGIKEGKGG